MDAIECGIVKLPRVPVADNLPKHEIPMYRNLWEHIGTKMPKKGRHKGAQLDPHSLPAPLCTALEALYGHYSKTYEDWQQAGTRVPPCFIVVCNNTSSSKLVYDYISGFHAAPRRRLASRWCDGRLELFRNFDEHGNPLGRAAHAAHRQCAAWSRVMLSIKKFRDMAADEIDRFRREIIERTGDRHQAQNITDQDLLREIMNTVGKPDNRLGSAIRCVVSVSMLTEGWDANNVTHILGVRAFGTQLLCEQVIGRALRRQSYDLDTNGHFIAEYADILGIPFDFTTKPVISPIVAPRETIHVRAMRPERDACEIRFPCVVGYRSEPPAERLTAEFNADSSLSLTPALIGATQTQNAGIIGESVNLDKCRDYWRIG